MKHNKGINLFEKIRCFDKNAIEEEDLVPKISRSNMRFAIDGKYSKLYSLMELQSNILNRKLS